MVFCTKKKNTRIQSITSSNQGLWGAFDGTGMVLGIGCEGVF